MCTNVNHNYGVPIDGIPPLLAVPLSGRVKIGIIDSKGEIQGQTTANQQGEWRSPFCLDDGEYTVEFRGNFRPIGTGFNALYNPPISSLSLSITVPLIPVDTTVEGATGAKGPRGISGPRGFSGRDGLAGSTGPVGAIGPEGQMGLQGFQGEKGNKGNIGSQGSMGQPGPGGARGVAGPQGPIGSQGASAVPGDACDLDIGTPTDGYLSDGLLPWEPTTKVCEAIDDVNEILLELAPDSPLSLEGVSLAMTGVSLFDGFASDKEYQNYKVGAGEDVDATYIGGKIIVADTFTLTNPTVGDRESGGDDTFYPGNEGILSSRITENGIEQERGSINLVTGSPSYDLSLTLNAQNANYNGFSLWVRGDATIDVDTYISSGYNKLIMRHNVNSANRNSEEYEVFDDTEPTVQSITVGPAAIENAPVYREFSGIRSYTLTATFNLELTGEDNFNDSYVEDAFVLDNSVFPGILGATIALTDLAWDGTISATPRFDDSPAVLGGYTAYVFSITETDQRATNARAGVAISKPGRTTTTPVEVTTNRLVDTFSDSSTLLDEPFNDEDYRQPNYDHDSVPTSFIDNWDSTVDLGDGEAAVFHGSLYHPASSSLPNSGDFSVSLPIGPDYSGFTSDAVYVRAFEDDGDPHNNGILELEGLTVADVSPVGSGNVNIEIKLPTETGWLDLGTPFNVALFTGADGDGCRTAQSGNDWSFTFGTFSTVDSEYTIIIRITIRNSSSVISRMRITDW